MDRVYAIAIDAFCHGISVRGSYTIARGPFGNEKDAVEQVDDVVNELADKYSSLGTCGKDNEIVVKTIDEKTKILVKTASEEPILRCSVLGVDMSNIVSLKSDASLRSGSSKKTTDEQKLLSGMTKKISQYIATLTPTTLNSSDLRG